MASDTGSEMYYTTWTERFSVPGTYFTLTRVGVLGPRLRDQYGVIHFVGGV